MHKNPDHRSWRELVDLEDPDGCSTLIIADVAAILAELATKTEAELDAELGPLWGDPNEPENQ